MPFCKEKKRISNMKNPVKNPAAVFRMPEIIRSKNGIWLTQGIISISCLFAAPAHALITADKQHKLISTEQEVYKKRQITVKVYQVGAEARLRKVVERSYQGKQHGVQEYYHPNGQLSHKITYKMGEPVGENRTYYHPNGKVLLREQFAEKPFRRMGYFESGRLGQEYIEDREGNGIETCYAECGAVRGKKRYTAGGEAGGVRIGLWKEYDKDCKLKAIEMAVPLFDSNVVVAGFSENRKKSEPVSNFNEKTANGDYRFFNDEGKLVAAGVYQQGKKTGEWQFRAVGHKVTVNYRNDEMHGVVATETEYYQYREGKKHGTYVFYRDDGKTVKEKGQYDADKKHGLYRYYFADGELQAGFEYSKGRLKGKATFYAPASLGWKNRLAATGYCDSRGVKTGSWKIYGINGLREDLTYRNDKITHYISYDNNGDIYFKGKVGENGEGVGSWIVDGKKVAADEKNPPQIHNLQQFGYRFADCDPVELPKEENYKYYLRE